MKVITYNLHKGRGPQRRDIVPEVVRALSERRPDLIVLQEVFHGREQEHQAPFIAEALGHQHVFGPNVFRAAGCHGNATFTRLHIARYVNIDISDLVLQKRGILRTWLQGEHGPIELLNLHFSLTGRQRRRQWRKLLASLPHDQGTPVLACGDFNDWGEVLDRHARRTGVLHNALWALPRAARMTFPARRPLLSLDRIYFRGLRLVDVEVLRGEPWRWMSDHLPVEATFAPGA